LNLYISLSFFLSVTRDREKEEEEEDDFLLSFKELLLLLRFLRNLPLNLDLTCDPMRRNDADDADDAEDGDDDDARDAHDDEEDGDALRFEAFAFALTFRFDDDAVR